MSELKIKLAVFEGPLDLLLHLIKTLEVDIYDIPIAEVTSQYIAYIESMKTLQLEVAGDYLVMAATLMAIKSKMLLPKEEAQVLDSEYSEEEGEDPREALVAQLLEYRKYKYAAHLLQEKESDRGNYYSKEPTDLSNYQEEIPPLEPDQVSTTDLFLAFHDILERRRSAEQLTTISAEETTVSEKSTLIKKRLKKADKSTGVSFGSLFTHYTRGEIVTTFMALLELIKKQEVIARQNKIYGEIQLFLNQ